MYNLRYHIASLVALFLALAIGLVLGGLVVQRGAVSRQQETLVRNLEEEFSQLRQENRSLTDANKLAGEFGAALTDEWVSGRLEGRTVLMVTNAGRASGAEAARTAIEDAAGTVASVIVLEPGLGLTDEAVRSLVSTLVTDAADDDELLASVCASLAAEWASSETTLPVTDALVEAGVIRLDGLEPGTPVSALVDLALDDGKAEAAGVRLAEAFAGFGPAVAAQMSGEQSGIAATADQAGVPAFDTLGTDVGRYTLVALLTGAKPGHYGTGDGTTAAFPELPELGR